MSSNLRVNNILPSVGTNVAIGTAGGSVTLTGAELSVSGGINVTGVSTFASLNVTGNVSIAGTLTYEDVTNIDSIGIVTARNGITVSAGGINATGVITATSFSGSGSGLTGIVNSGITTVAAGTTSAPSISPSGDSNTGIFFPSADTIAFAEGGAEAMRIDSSSRLLVGTSSSSNVTRAEFYGQSTSSTEQAIVRFGRGSNPSGAGDHLTTLQFAALTSGGVYATIEAMCDGTPGASDYPGRIVLATTADGASSPTARFKIANQGRHSMFSEDYVLALRSASAASGIIEAIYVARSATSLESGTGVFAVYTNGTYATLSDQTQKKNIETTRDGYLDDINKLRVVKYNWNEQEDNEPKELGLIAQEVEQVFPGLINEMRSEEGELPKKGVKAGVLPYMLIKALQEATARIEALEVEVAALKAQ